MTNPFAHEDANPVCAGCGVTDVATDPAPLVVLPDGVEVYAACCKDHPVRGPAPVSRSAVHVACFLIVHRAIDNAVAMRRGVLTDREVA